MTTLGIGYGQQDASEDRGLRQFLLGGFALVALSLVGWWGTSVESRLSADHDRVSELESAQRADRQRFDVIVEGMKEGETRIHNQLRWQDEKLDRITGLLMKDAASGPSTVAGSSRRFDK